MVKENNKYDRYFMTAWTAMVFAAAALFFGLGYKYHIAFQEKYQLFEWTWSYFAETVSVPGGFADWCGRFLTQFFISTWVGSVIVALLLSAVHLLTSCLSNRKSLSFFVLCSIVPLPLFFFMLDEKALLGAPVAVILVLLASVKVSQMKRSAVRTAVTLVGIPVLYFLCGPVTLIFAVVCCFWEKPLVWGTALLLCAICPIAARFLFHYHLWQFYAGVHYFRFPTDVPWLLWISVAAILLCIVIPCRKANHPKQKHDRVSAVLLSVVIVIMAFVGVKKAADFSDEEVMRYDWLCYHGEWNEIIRRQFVKPADKPFTVCCLNLALCKAGLMSEQMFSFRQYGVPGLFPKFKINYTSPVQTAEVFWNLGMVSACQNYIFEAQESIPDFQKSARCYVRLAQTNIIDGRYDVARRYLNSLCNTLFYRKWAQETAAMLQDEDAVAANGTIALKRSLRLKHDILFSEDKIDGILREHVIGTPDNQMAYEYLLAWDMLEKNGEAFMRDFVPERHRKVPKHYQEAVLMSIVSAGGLLDDAPSYIDEAVSKRLLAFIADVKAGKSDSFMHKKYGDTYWFYSLYR
ncbi:MAG: hypothetical protein KBS57_03300 [Alistipes sp.]|nr:hypothetical protein [Candidatus Minthomonas equi]